MSISEQKRKWYEEQMKYLIVDKTMTKSDIARALGILPQHLNSIDSGVRGLSDKFLDQFAETFELKPLVLSLGTKKVERPDEDLLKVIASQQETIARLTKVIERLTAGEKKDQDALTA